jgi:hypothetical protein
MSKKLAKRGILLCSLRVVLCDLFPKNRDKLRFNVLYYTTKDSKYITKEHQGLFGHPHFRVGTIGRSLMPAYSTGYAMVLVLLPVMLAS